MEGEAEAVFAIGGEALPGINVNPFLRLARS
jgi:hypothetical protein